jgi:hypothetical protein
MSGRTKPISEADESATLSVSLAINGRPRTIAVEPRTKLLDALRRSAPFPQDDTS